MPRTYMGDGFTNNTLPGGTTSFNITKLTLNQQLDDDQFELKIPENLPVETMK